MPLPATLPPPDTLRELSSRLAGIWEVMRRGFGPWSRHEPGFVPQAACRKAGRLFARVQAILALLGQGRLPRTYPPRPKRAPPPPGTAETPETPPEKPRKPPPPWANEPWAQPVALPRRPGWLLRATGRYVDPSQRDSVAGAAGILRWWLADPAVRAAMEEVPQLRRPLRSLCRMLLIAPWPAPPDQDFLPDPPRTRKPRPPKPRRETLAELRASLRHHPCMEIELGLISPDARPYWLPPFRKPRPRKPG